MASAQVDLLNMSSIMPDRSGNASSDHAASGSFTPDANALREAALKSRRKKQAAAREQATYDQQSTVHPLQPLVGEDSPMHDASSTPMVDTPVIDTPKLQEKPIDTEDGEIPESSQENKISSIDTEADTRERTPRPPSTVSAPSSDTTEARKYVRPGLNMTAEDLDEAKHLILDLLGLGVTPEYLVDCGVSSQCLAVCFYELNLRFPLNLDRRQIDLPPFYDLDKHMKDSQRREQIIRQRDRGLAHQKPPLVAIMGAAGHTEPSHGGKSSPPASPESREKPIGSSPLVRLDMNIGQGGGSETISPQSIEPEQPSSKEVDTTSMEDQKRMELLARKAAMDSINKKRAAKNSGLTLNTPGQFTALPLPIEIKDVESAVDALLASVRKDSESSNQSEGRSSKECEDESTTTEDQLPEYDSDAMVEDELETRSPSPSDPEIIDQLMDTPVLADTQRNISPEPISSNTPALVLSPKSALSRVRFNAPDPLRSSSLPAQPMPLVVPVVARRSRPIASDFIDQAPPRPASASRAGPERFAPLKRKRSFVDPAVWPKRLVIDLDSSDEEDSQDEGVATGAAGSSSSSSKGTDRAPSRTASHDKQATGGHDQAAQMLLEKELQIKAMMQKIKMRELQKKKSASGSRTPVPIPATPASTTSPSKAATPSAEPMSSPIASTVNLTPMATPSFEAPPTMPAIERVSTPAPTAKENHLVLNESSVSPKVDKGKDKALEPKGIPQDNLSATSTVVQSDNEARLDQPLDPNNTQAPTHFKAYVSPLAGFTSPDLQHSRPTDQQLSAILWISSSAGQNMDRQLCMYEFPSGICKNEGCKDIHARDFGASDDEIRKTVRTMFPNARPETLSEIVTRVQQSVQTH